MKSVDIYTDGACSGNPGPGGWGAILKYGEVEKEISGGERMTTNNRMELMAAIASLSLLKEPCHVTLYSDSKYLVDSLTKGWVYSWEKNNFVKKGKAVPNTDLWRSILMLVRKHEVEFVWVKGHAENPYNNRCDELAVTEWKKIKGE
ncbi:MAG: ribonuclease HI [Spirochaetes bacterium]|uniref:Ribonuclease H n=1 Tax=Candidatus Ornithospirochaeta stercoripullorum TaxID=2840899 RepID=A0A9D9DZ46_9SPIO|nr:ribonuclease HI [Candidatus Ornithospirochaeta stercoripullorum]